MSRIAELIEELCPNGVPYKELSKVARRNKGINITAGKMKQIVVPNGNIRIFAAGQNFVDTDENFVDKLKVIHEPSVIVKSRGNIGFEYYEKPFQHKNEMWSYQLVLDEVNLKFIFYFLSSKAEYFQNLAKATSVKLPQLSVKDTDNYKIPVPPLKIQEEIVRILDRFTLLEAELEAELEARRKQYAFYLESLLSFDNGGCRFVSFGEIAEISRGASPRPIRNFLASKGEGVPWIKIGDVPAGGKYITQTKEYVSIEGAKRSREIIEGDFIISNSMSFGRPYISKINGCIHDGWLKISQYEDSFDSGYLYYLLRSNYVQKQFQSGASSGTVSNLNADIVRKVKLPVPSLDEQRKVAAMLDRFDTLINDISSGLPAEIAARRKQYEYYRDQLLTFKELQPEAA